MQPSEAHRRLTAILARDFQIDPDRATPDAHLRADLGFDSLTLTDLAFLVQSDLGFKASAEDFRDVRTVADLSAVIARHAR